MSDSEQTLSSDPVTDIGTFSVQELFETLDASQGEVVIDLGVDDSFDSRVFVRVYNGNPQLLRVEGTSEDNSQAEISSGEIELDEFESIVTNFSTAVIRPREKTPFSREVQDELRNN